jgi:hypothetical protein
VWLTRWAWVLQSGCSSLIFAIGTQLAAYEDAENEHGDPNENDPYSNRRNDEEPESASRDHEPAEHKIESRGYILELSAIRTLITLLHFIDYLACDLSLTLP